MAWTVQAVGISCLFLAEWSELWTVDLFTRTRACFDSFHVCILHGTEKTQNPNSSQLFLTTGRGRLILVASSVLDPFWCIPRTFESLTPAAR